MLFIGAFIVALGLERWNVHRRMALWIVSRVGTRPRRLVLGFMAASAFLSMWINNTSTTLLMLPIGMAVVASFESKDEESCGAFAIALLLGMAYSASVGGVGTPVGTAPNQVFLGHLRNMFPGGPELSFGEWLFAWLPLVLLYLPLAWLLLTRVVTKVPSTSSTEISTIAEERAKMGKMSPAERRMALLFFVTALLWVTRADLRIGSFLIPGWVRLVLPGVEEPARWITDATVALAMALLCFVVPSGERPGERLMNWTTAKRMPWEVLLLIGGGFALAAGFQHSGLDETLGGLLGEVFAGKSTWLIVLPVVGFMTALTEITSNTATTAVLIPILGRAAVDAGISPLVTMVPATIAASAAFMLPVATPPNAVVFSSGLIPPQTMARIGLWMNLLLILLITLVFQLWVRDFLGIEAELPAWAQATGSD